MVDAVQVGLAAVFFALFGFIALYLIRRLRQRRQTALEASLGGAPEYVDDRSFNQIRMARSESGILARRGLDVHRANALLEDAEGAMARRDFATAYSTARTAHEMLVRLQASPEPAATPRAATPRPSGSAFPVPVATGVFPSSRPSSFPSIEESDAQPAPAIRLEKNQAESRFQLSVLRDEIARAQQAGGNPAGWKDAELIQTEAEAAFVKGAYTDAMRLALRGRRALGARIDTLPPSAPRRVAAARASDPGNEPSEKVGAPTPCPNCGNPVRPSDKFCRSCGAPRMDSATCPRCRQPVLSADVFCANCGSPLA